MEEVEIERKYLLLPTMADALLSALDMTYKKARMEQFYVSTKASPYTRYRKKGIPTFKPSRAVKDWYGRSRKKRSVKKSIKHTKPDHWGASSPKTVIPLNIKVMFMKWISSRVHLMVCAI